MTDMPNIQNYPSQTKLTPLTGSESEEVKASSQTEEFGEVDEMNAKINEIAIQWENTPPKTINIFERVLKRIISMNQTMQGLTMEQGKALDILTRLIRGEVERQSTIPVVVGKGSGIDLWDGTDTGTKTKHKDARAEANNAFSIMMQAVAASKGLSEDEAKQMQSLLQTNKDAVVAWSDFFSSLLDQMRNGTSSVFRA